MTPPRRGGRRERAESGRSGELRFAVRLTPRAGLDRVDGVEGGALRCRVAAPPADGAANEALLRLVAHDLGVPRSAIRLIRGERSRDKVVAVAAALRDRVDARWPGLLDPTGPDV